jgi:Flp pilus assembly CpaF family ATPase
VPTFDRILAAYEDRLRRLADDLVREIDPPEDERAQLMLVVQILQAVVHAYDSYQLNRAPSLEAATSVMYAAAAGDQGRRVLNVPLRSLVDNNTVSPYYARYLNGSLGLNRSLIISGGPSVGKATLLNALIEFLPRDRRLVVVDDGEVELPALRDRSFMVQLTAKHGTPARVTVFRKAAEMKPNWVIARDLVRRDGPAFLETLTGGASGLATVSTPDPEAILGDWLAMKKETAAHLSTIKPLIIHMERDQGGRPRVLRVFEAVTDEDRLVLTPIQPD